MKLRVTEIDDVGKNPVEVKINGEWVDLDAEVVFFSRGNYKVIINFQRNEIRPK